MTITITWVLFTLLILATGIWIGSILPHHEDKRDDCD